MSEEKAFVTVKIGDKEHKVPYTKHVADFKEGMTDAEVVAEIVKISGTLEKALADHGYGADLRVKAKVRQKFMAELEGPDKAISKAAKALAVVLGVTEEQAEAIVRQQRTDLGLDQES